MMQPPNEVSSKTSGAGDASTSRHLTNHDWTVIDVLSVTDESPAVPLHDECPNCALPAWMTRAGHYTAVCGSAWDDWDGVTYQAPSCYVIESKNERIEMLEREVRELRAGTADVDDVEAPSEVAA